MLYELNYVLKKLKRLNKNMHDCVLLKDKIKNAKEEINDFDQIQDKIDKYISHIKQIDESKIAIMRGSLLRIHIKLSCCNTNIRHVQKLTKKLISDLC